MAGRRYARLCLMVGCVCASTMMGQTCAKHVRLANYYGTWADTAQLTLADGQGTTINCPNAPPVTAVTLSFVGVPEWLDGDQYVAYASMKGHAFEVAGQPTAAAFVAQRECLITGQCWDDYGFSAHIMLDAHTELLIYPTNAPGAGWHEVVWGWDGCWNFATRVPLHPSTCPNPGIDGCRQYQTTAFLPITSKDRGDSCSWNPTACSFTGEIYDPDLGQVCPDDHPYNQISGVQDPGDIGESLCCNCAPF